MLFGLILVCSLATTPDVRNCDMTTAIRYDRAEDGSALPLMCLKYAEEWYGKHGHVGPGEYMRIVCSRSTFRGHVG